MSQISTAWRIKPPAGTRLNRSHPLARGLVACWAFNEGGGLSIPNLADNGDATLVNGPTWGQNRYGNGPELNFSAASSQYVDCAVPARLLDTGDLTIMTHYRLASSTTATAYELVSKDSDVGGRSFTLDVYNTATTSGAGVRFYVNGGGGAGDIVAEARTPLAGDDRCVLATYLGGASPVIAIYIDGRIISSAAPLSNIPASTTNVFIGRRNYSGFNDPFDGSIRYVFIWNRYFSVTEAYAAYTNPWQIFSPIRRNRVIANTVIPPTTNSNFFALMGCA